MHPARKRIAANKILLLQTYLFMDFKDASPEAKERAAELFRKGKAEGKESAQIILEAAQDFALTYGEELHTLKGQFQKMEGKIEYQERKAGTAAIFGKGSVPSFKEELSQVLSSNIEGLKDLTSNRRERLTIQTKTVGDMSLGNLTGGTASISAPVVGPVGMAYRLNNVQDLLRQVQMTGMYLPVLKDNGGEGTVTPVAENAAKPQVDFDLAEANAKAETIAAIAKVSNQFLADVQNGTTWLVDRLSELYFAAVNDQLLNGGGTTPNLKGLNTAGNFTAFSGAATIDIEQLIQGILQLRILKRRASGIIINPASLESLILNKASGSGEYDLPSLVTVGANGQLIVMGVPVIDVSEQPAGTFTIHDNTGSMLAIRENVKIEFFNEVLASTNQTLIRIESRMAFPVFGASYTVKGSF
jgi:HK97 family phage major capsid protein